jgi:hypothetical protein
MEVSVNLTDIEDGLDAAVGNVYPLRGGNGGQKGPHVHNHRCN